MLKLLNFIKVEKIYNGRNTFFVKICKIVKIHQQKRF
jgi:hypothetical protein